MNLNEMKKLRTILKDYVDYEGINLWELCEWEMYPIFLRKTKRKGEFKKFEDKIKKALVKIDYFRNQKQKINLHFQKY